MTIDGKNKQEVRVQIDICITVRAEHDVDEIEGIIMRGVHNVFPNNPSIIHKLCYAEERDVHFESFVLWKEITGMYKNKNEKTIEV